MIYVRLAGGLGNQLFQLTAALFLKGKVNMPISFYTNHLKNYETPREFVLQEILPKEFPLQFSKPNGLVQTILKYRINKAFPFLFKWSITSKNIVSVKPSKFYVLDDYFQDITTLKNELNIVANYIKQAANNNKKVVDIYNSNNQFSNAVALHIRRGDYLNKEYSKILVTQPNSYYNNALDSINENVTSIILFSKDKIEDLSEMTNFQIVFSNELKLNDVEEFLLMCKFSKLIISNSTYSFWAAVASKHFNNDVSVVAPKNWYYKYTDNNIWLNNLNICNIKII